MSQSASATMNSMQLHHGRGIGSALAGTAAGFGSSVVLGTLYGRYHDKWYGQWMPAFFAAGGKTLALVTLDNGRDHTRSTSASSSGFTLRGFSCRCRATRPRWPLTPSASLATYPPLIPVAASRTSRSRTWRIFARSFHHRIADAS